MESRLCLLPAMPQPRGFYRRNTLIAVACSLQLLTSAFAPFPTSAAAPLPGAPQGVSQDVSQDAKGEMPEAADIDPVPVQIYTPDAVPESLLTPPPAVAPIIAPAHAQALAPAPAPFSASPVNVQNVVPSAQAHQASVQDIQTWQKLEKSGEKAFYACEYGNAERLFTQAVSLARTFAPGDTRLAKSSGELGRLLTVRGRFSEAEPLLEDELRIKILAFGNGDGKLIPDMAAMVRFYLLHGTATKADPLSEKILSYVEGKLNEAGDETKGKVKLQAGQPLKGWAGEAAPVMRDPLIEWAIACDMIGNLYSARSALPENFALADRLFKAALDVKSTVLGKQHLSLANSYDSLGALALQRHHDEEAESYYKDALEITERVLQPGDPQIYNRLDKLAKCQILLGKFDDAEALYLKAQGFWKAEPSTNGSDARNMFALGCLYAQEKKYAEAAPFLTKALEMQQVNLGPDSVSLAPYLDKLAYVQYYLGNRAETDQLRARAHEIAPPVPAEPTLTMKAKPLDQ